MIWFSVFLTADAPRGFCTDYTILFSFLTLCRFQFDLHGNY